MVNFERFKFSLALINEIHDGECKVTVWCNNSGDYCKTYLVTLFTRRIHLTYGNPAYEVMRERICNSSYFESRWVEEHEEVVLDTTFQKSPTADDSFVCEVKYACRNKVLT